MQLRYTTFVVSCRHGPCRRCHRWRRIRRRHRGSRAAPSGPGGPGASKPPNGSEAACSPNTTPACRSTSGACGSEPGTTDSPRSPAKREPRRFRLPVTGTRCSSTATSDGATTRPPRSPRSECCRPGSCSHRCGGSTECSPRRTRRSASDPGRQPPRRHHRVVLAAKCGSPAGLAPTDRGRAERGAVRRRRRRVHARVADLHQIVTAG